MTIDPLESIIQWLKTDLTSVQGRVANKQRFTDTWARGQKCISVHMDSALPETYPTVTDLRTEIRIYAAVPADVADVWAALATLARTKKRFTVVTSQGTALVHYFIQTSGLSMPYDDDLKMDIGVVFFNALVSEEAIV